MVRQMHCASTEAIGDSGAGWAPRLVVRSEHEVVDEELRTSPEEVLQPGAPFIRVKSVILFDPNPRQFLPPSCQLVAAPRQFLFRLEQVESGLQPLVTCCDRVFGHSLGSFRLYVGGVRQDSALAAGECGLNAPN